MFSSRWAMERMHRIRARTWTSMVEPGHFKEGRYVDFLRWPSLVRSMFRFGQWTTGDLLSIRGPPPSRTAWLSTALSSKNVNRGKLRWAELQPEEISPPQ